MDSVESKKENLLQMRLSDTEKGKLFAFNQDKDMVRTLEKVILYCLYEMGTVKKEDSEHVEVVNWAMSISNSTMSLEDKGKALETVVCAIGMLQDAFKQVAKFGVEKASQVEENNPAMG